MPNSQTNDENFTMLRCNNCRKVLLEVSNNTTGIVRKKCDGCRQMRTIVLPLSQKNNTLQRAAAFAPA